MYLIDCFIPAMTYAVETLQGVTENSELDCERFRQRLLQLISEHTKVGGAGTYRPEDYQNALFAVVAFLDEQVMSSAWSQRNRWAGALLQRELFGTTRGGVEFFQRLDALNPFSPVDRDIREVYYYCLALGFAGQYYRSGDKVHLAELIAANAEILCADIRNETLLETPGALQRRPPATLPVWQLPRTPFYVGLPLLLILSLFMYCRQGILDAVNALLLSI